MLSHHADACRAAQERLPYAEEVLVLRADVDERLQRISELEHQVWGHALTQIAFALVAYCYLVAKAWSLCDAQK